jgi:hypothetical protein
MIIASLVLVVLLTGLIIAYAVVVTRQVEKRLPFEVPTIGFSGQMPFLLLQEKQAPQREQCYMGHSLRTLFVDEQGDPAKGRALMIANLNAGTKVRIVLLDPNNRNSQQMREVGEAQARGDERREVSQDIRDSLAAIAKIREGLDDRAKRNLTVKVTRRILYVSINKFDDDMIVGHYLHKGLGSRSVHFHIRRGSDPSVAPLFDAYEKEFDSVWADKETENITYTGL